MTKTRQAHDSVSRNLLATTMMTCASTATKAGRDPGDRNAPRRAHWPPRIPRGQGARRNRYCRRPSPNARLPRSRRACLVRGARSWRPSCWERRAPPYWSTARHRSAFWRTDHSACAARRLICREVYAVRSGGLLKHVFRPGKPSSPPMSPCERACCVSAGSSASKEALLPSSAKTMSTVHPPSIPHQSFLCTSSVALTVRGRPASCSLRSSHMSGRYSSLLNTWL
mmetsp:Transcript_64394/g.177987  ORF Transcript_64394/g.177987 Transcript_64394/m.177987 type:complete len:226 (+) Transcript_64394:102-779(+)